ncbi:Response regulators consisting of a CheY-like receiver domain and a HTH DNA-binding domain [Pedobacter sp. BAL39]|uniref:response regulator transcription factor n=1 Tax=Pedobacter sp. BAL39 TaxID=391596 RepID=UPI0001559CAC|nr:response regulator transcription factor [Pedobacter sp. BAL39]EDM37803.1 Response regulators consisting of a CheY-like receiver domain and a HTH DNA-binding domain [Pedobacter sp. BAL39]
MPKKIMICDDDAGILEMMEMIMDEYGFDVITQANSLNVLQGLQQEKPDLLLLDIWMPLLSGDQVLKNIKADVQFNKLPVIMYSASSEGRSIAENAGADDYIDKPFDMNELEVKIRQLIV